MPKSRELLCQTLVDSGFATLSLHDLVAWFYFVRGLGSLPVTANFFESGTPMNTAEKFVRGGGSLRVRTANYLCEPNFFVRAQEPRDNLWGYTETAAM